MGRVSRAVSVLLIVFAAVRPAFGAGVGEFELAVPADGGERTIRVFDFVPESGAERAPVVFVIHGVSRNADGYFKVWRPLAEMHGFLLLVPEFSRDDFPGAAAFSQANVTDRAGLLNAEPEWRFQVIDRVFEVAKRRFRNGCTRYGIYGHSAGGQFVHRMVLLATEAPISVAVAANAGWYSFADLATPWPFGLAGIPDAEARLRRAFATKLIVLLGDRDTDPNHRQLSRSNGAMAQGAHRFARGGNFFAKARQQAESLGAAFNWEKDVVPGVAHSNRGMSKAAAEQLARRVTCE